MILDNNTTQPHRYMGCLICGCKWKVSIKARNRRDIQIASNIPPCPECSHLFGHKEELDMGNNTYTIAMDSSSSIYRLKELAYIPNWHDYKRKRNNTS